MFCTRCGQAVGHTDRACATCSNDLSKSGAIRLTDPAILGDTTDGPPAEWFRDQHKTASVAANSAPAGDGSPQPSAAPAPLVVVPPTVATWRPPPPQQPQVTYPNVDYVPKPEPGGLRNSAVMLALIGLVGLALILVVGVAIRFLRPADRIVLADSAPPTVASPSKVPSTSEASEEATPEQSTASPTPAASLGATLPAGVTECAPNVGAGRNTSCEFALNVASQVDRVDSAQRTSTFQVTAKSPVTGQSYTMSCSPASGMIVCVGGNSASVYLLTGS